MNRRKQLSVQVGRKSRSRSSAKQNQSQTVTDRKEAAAQSQQLIAAKRAARKRGWLAEQNRRFQKALLEQASLRSFSSGSPVFEVDDFGGGLYGVIEGTFGSYVPRRNGEDALVNIVRPGMWFGYGPFLTRRNRLKTFIALEPALALYVTLRELDRLATLDVVYQRSLTRISEYGMEIAIDTISDLLIPETEKRIAATLLRVARTKGVEPTGPLVILGLTQAQIGELANAARDVVNRALKRFEAKGWIEVSYRRIALLEPKAIEKFCS